MLVGREVKDNKLWLSYFDRDGKVRIDKIPVPQSEMFEWVLSKDPTEWKTYNGAYIKKQPIGYRNTIRWKFRLEELTQRCTESVRSKIFEYNIPKITYLDIEIYVNENNDFTDPSVAEFPINVMSLVQDDFVVILTTFDKLGEEKQNQMQDEVNEYFKRFNSKFQLVFYYFNDEKSLLEFFAKRLLPKISCISGWNVIEYDWQYITNRCYQLGVQLLGSLESQSTSGKFKLPMHTGIVDFMEAFDEIDPYHGIENLKLNTIAEKALGTTKLKNPYNTFGEYMKDTYLFIKYNIIDSCLLPYIEIETRVLESTFALCNEAEVELSNVFKSVYVTEMQLCKKYYKRGIMLPVTPRGDIVKNKYKGAFVMEPRVGYFENVVCFDFNSMYPNIMIQFNISPETYLGYSKDIDVENVGSYTKTAQETCFATDVPSVTGEFLREKYDLRKSIQAEMREKKKVLDELENKVK